ncbi:hypothetical protein [uncultured Sulfitobacter sp.]|uniref:hypothetical protein n=1 Tax=uncultured Sulfitobacter sp. TaxID=191468 RepID=UPI00261FF79D|nr:hypothetical protein [uncultured Sulfitobacter sp.]
MLDIAKTMASRTRLLGPDISTLYDDPLHLVGLNGVWIYYVNAGIILRRALK